MGGQDDQVSTLAEGVQDFLENILEREGILLRKIIDLRVMVFPARPLRTRPRRMLHGSYNHNSSQISLYPLKLPRDWIRREGFSLFKTKHDELAEVRRKVLEEICESAVSTLLHEVFHVKYDSTGISRYAEETIVRKLEKKYMIEWESRFHKMIGNAEPIRGAQA